MIVAVPGEVTLASGRVIRGQTSTSQQTGRAGLRRYFWAQGSIGNESATTKHSDIHPCHLPAGGQNGLNPFL